eukprot:m.23218 g.23218  ORF g.23218 m.23218 type:complete len:82 (+) comp5530_c0_seq4:27-272(+)
MYLVGFGEAMIRYAPQANASPQADPNAQLMLRSIGGDELNVCVATSKLNSNKDLPNSEVLLEILCTILASWRVLIKNMLFE